MTARNPFSFGILALAAIVPISAMAATAHAAVPSPDQALERMREADINHDGAISRAELLATRKSEWQRFDRNGDGYFSQDDLPAFLRDRWNGGRLAQMRTSFDANGDGRISQAEFVDGPTPAFDMADTNHDGRVTEAELKTAIAAAKAARQ